MQIERDAARCRSQGAESKGRMAAGKDISTECVVRRIGVQEIS